MRAPWLNDVFLKDATEFQCRHCGHALSEEVLEEFSCPEQAIMISAAIRLLDRLLVLALASGLVFFHIFCSLLLASFIRTCGMETHTPSGWGEEMPPLLSCTDSHRTIATGDTSDG